VEKVNLIASNYKKQICIGASFSAPKSLGNQVDSLGSSKSASIAFGGAASSKSKEYWAKGTGFGSGTTSSEFNLLSNISQKKQNEVVVTYLLNVRRVLFICSEKNF
jgi:hypothetical protein